MRPTYLVLAMIVQAEPSVAAELVKQALGRAGAVITSAQRLGNQALVFGFELAGQHVALLRPQLSAVGRLLDEAEAQLDAAERAVVPGSEVVGSLHVSLVHTAPDERVELPRVPG